MQDNLTYKGYQGHIEIDLDSDIFFGRVLDIKDVITFQGKTLEEACQAFYDSIDDYLEFCEDIILSTEAKKAKEEGFIWVEESEKVLHKLASTSAEVWSPQTDKKLIEALSELLKTVKDEGQ